MSQRIVQETLALAEKANFYLISVGECDERAFLFENRYLSALELSEPPESRRRGRYDGQIL